MNGEDGSTTPIEATLSETILKLSEPRLHYGLEGFYRDAVTNPTTPDNCGPAVQIVGLLAGLKDADVDRARHPVIAEFESGSFPKDRLEVEYDKDLARAVIDLGRLAGITISAEVGSLRLDGKANKPNYLNSFISEINLPEILKKRMAEQKKHDQEGSGGKGPKTRFDSVRRSFSKLGFTAGMFRRIAGHESNDQEVSGAIGEKGPDFSLVFDYVDKAKFGNHHRSEGTSYTRVIHKIRLAQPSPTSPSKA